MKNKRKGFTLAEVLITLTIIGAVAALTIPTIVSNINNTTNVIQLKKTFSDLQQAFILLQAENGGSIIPVFENDTTTNGGNGAVLNAFLVKLNYIKNCGNAMGCFYDTPLYYLNESMYSSKLDNFWNGKYEKAILSNSITLVIDVKSTNCTNSRGIGPLNNNVCSTLGVDINGASRPNKWGRDYFEFFITQTGIYPKGSFNDGYNCNISLGDDPNSRGCAAKVLTEGAMNY